MTKTHRIAFAEGWLAGSLWGAPSNREAAAALDAMGLPTDGAHVAIYANGADDGVAGDYHRLDQMEAK